jgi:hypothetical protein
MSNTTIIAISIFFIIDILLFWKLAKSEKSNNGLLLILMLGIVIQLLLTTILLYWSENATEINSRHFREGFKAGFDSCSAKGHYRSVTDTLYKYIP